MKKLFMVGLIVLMASTIISAKHYKPMFGGGLGFDFMNTSSGGYSDSDFGFQMAAEGMAPIYIIKVFMLVPVCSLFERVMLLHFPSEQVHHSI